MYFLLAKNQIKAGQLNVIQLLVDAMTVHKADARVASQAAAALGNICGDNGVLTSYYTCICVWLEGTARLYLPASLIMKF